MEGKNIVFYSTNYVEKYEFDSENRVKRIVEANQTSIYN